MARLLNKVAIVTGAALGMGAAEAKLFAKEGAKVVATDIQEGPLQQLADEITAAGGTVLTIKHNVASEADWAQVVEKALATFGRVDVLVNNAGVSGGPTPAHETSLDDWHRIIEINMTGTFLGMKYVLPEMMKVGGGSIINIASIAGLTGRNGAGPYTASKGGVRMLSRAAARDYAKANIRVNCVCPGIIETPMTKELMATPQYRQWFESSTPMPRLGRPEDVAYGVLWLASDESSWVTGVELPIDGGYTA